MESGIHTVTDDKLMTSLFNKNSSNKTKSLTKVREYTILYSIFFLLVMSLNFIISFIVIYVTCFSSLNFENPLKKHVQSVALKMKYGSVKLVVICLTFYTMWFFLSA